MINRVPIAFPGWSDDQSSRVKPKQPRPHHKPQRGVVEAGWPPRAAARSKLIRPQCGRTAGCDSLHATVTVSWWNRRPIPHEAAVLNSLRAWVAAYNPERWPAPPQCDFAPVSNSTREQRHTRAPRGPRRAVVGADTTGCDPSRDRGLGMGVAHAMKTPQPRRREAGSRGGTTQYVAQWPETPQARRPPSTGTVWRRGCPTGFRLQGAFTQHIVLNGGP